MYRCEVPTQRPKLIRDIKVELEDSMTLGLTLLSLVAPLECDISFVFRSTTGPLFSKLHWLSRSFSRYSK